jgi:hypothetical protein
MCSSERELRSSGAAIDTIYVTAAILAAVTCVARAEVISSLQAVEIDHTRAARTLVHVHITVAAVRAVALLVYCRKRPSFC